jgi:hypothetical protein
MRCELPGVVEETRFDAETVRQAVLLATRLQAEREKTLSAAEVEALGAELGIEPACLRQALAAVRQREPGATASASNRRVYASIALGCSLLLGTLLSTRLLNSVPVIASATPAGPAVVVPLVNPGFQEATLPKAGPVLPAGSHAIRGWVATRDTIDYVRDPATGEACVHLRPNGGIRQTFRTEPGRQYRVTFRMGARPGLEGRVQRVYVDAANTSNEFSVFVGPEGAAPPEWTLQSFDFRSQEIGTTIEIYAPADSEGPAGALIDDVSVVALP